MRLEELTRKDVIPMDVRDVLVGQSMTKSRGCEVPSDRQPSPAVGETDHRSAQRHRPVCIQAGPSGTARDRRRCHGSSVRQPPHRDLRAGHPAQLARGVSLSPHDAALRRWTLPLRGVPSRSFRPRRAAIVGAGCTRSRCACSYQSRRNSPPSRCTSARNVPRELHRFSAADRSAYDRDAYEFEPAGGTPLRVERWPYAWMEYFPRQRHA
jgi:hypothetical protein